MRRRQQTPNCCLFVFNLRTLFLSQIESFFTKFLFHQITQPELISLAVLWLERHFAQTGSRLNTHIPLTGFLMSLFQIWHPKGKADISTCTFPCFNLVVVTQQQDKHLTHILWQFALLSLPWRYDSELFWQVFDLMHRISLISRASVLPTLLNVDTALLQTRLRVNHKKKRGVEGERRKGVVWWEGIKKARRAGRKEGEDDATNVWQKPLQIWHARTSKSWHNMW